MRGAARSWHACGPAIFPDLASKVSKLFLSRTTFQDLIVCGFWAWLQVCPDGKNGAAAASEAQQSRGVARGSSR